MDFYYIEVGQFLRPEYLPGIRKYGMGKFQLPTEDGERWFTISFHVQLHTPYSRMRLIFKCPQCRGRTRVLYLQDEGLKCRRCLGRGYKSTELKDDPFFCEIIRPFKELQALEAKLSRKYPEYKRQRYGREALRVIETLHLSLQNELKRENEEMDRACEKDFNRVMAKRKYLTGLWSDFQALLKLSNTDPTAETRYKEFNRKLRMVPKYA